MRIVEEFPREIEVLDPVFIELSDGIRLAARIWLPKDAREKPVPAILEYLPYRRRDGTAERDALTHPYFTERTAVTGEARSYRRATAAEPRRRRPASSRRPAWRDAR